MFPDRPADAAANPVLRDGVRSMLTASLDKTLPALLAPVALVTRCSVLRPLAALIFSFLSKKSTLTLFIPSLHLFPENFGCLKRESEISVAGLTQTLMVRDDHHRPRATAVSSP
jgi:hypothetical protein